MSIKFKLYVPEDEKNIENIWEMLKKIESSYRIEIAEQGINKNEEADLKSQILWPIAVSKKIRIHQTGRAKSLYPQLILFINDKPFTFYTQSRAGNKITIEEFLEGVLEGQVKCLHDEEELAEKIMALKL